MANNETNASKQEEYILPRYLLVSGVICIAALGLFAGSLLAAMIVYQIQKRECMVRSDEISNFSTPNTSQCEEMNRPSQRPTKKNTTVLTV